MTGDARRRRMLTKPFPPHVEPPDQPGHRYRCYKAKEPVAGAACGCDVYARLEACSRSKSKTVLLAAALLAWDP